MRGASSIYAHFYSGSVIDYVVKSNHFIGWGGNHFTFSCASFSWVTVKIIKYLDMRFYESILLNFSFLVTMIRVLILIWKSAGYSVPV